MSSRELTAAGIHDPELRASYETCRRLNAAHGRTYYLATRLLPPGVRPHVHALYGFARYADEIVDDLGSAATPADKERRLRHWGERFLAGGPDDAVTRAARHTATVHALPLRYFADFLDSMAMDLSVTGYPTYDALLGYVHGSAAVIGLQMLPVLGTVVPRHVAEPYARDLGIAFQLANFIRDVGEDLRRGRVYLPAEDLAAFGVTREHLARGVADGAVRRLLAFEIARARELFRAARPGLRLVAPQSRDCLEVAFVLYSGILDAVERADYQVLGRRASVPLRRRATVALPGLVRARRARRPG